MPLEEDQCNWLAGGLGHLMLGPTTFVDERASPP